MGNPVVGASHVYARSALCRTCPERTQRCPLTRKKVQDKMRYKEVTRIELKDGGIPVSWLSHSQLCHHMLLWCEDSH